MTEEHPSKITLENLVPVIGYLKYAKRLEEPMFFNNLIMKREYKKFARKSLYLLVYNVLASAAVISGAVYGIVKGVEYFSK